MVLAPCKACCAVYASYDFKVHVAFGAVAGDRALAHTTPGLLRLPLPPEGPPHTPSLLLLPPTPPPHGPHLLPMAGPPNQISGQYSLIGPAVMNVPPTYVHPYSVISYPPAYPPVLQYTLYGANISTGPFPLWGYPQYPWYLCWACSWGIL
ncbi:hypothetical protein EDB84DRAFT_1434039 [Lactarius hengduanensis]|nr:hypothetical protein EDB84DRAFT_1434039 [Lactarius hengduanensis]